MKVHCLSLESSNVNCFLEQYNALYYFLKGEIWQKNYKNVEKKGILIS